MITIHWKSGSPKFDHLGSRDGDWGVKMMTLWVMGIKANFLSPLR